MKFIYSLKLHNLIIPFFILGFNLPVQAQINVQWESRYDNSSELDQAVDMVIDASGNVYVTGNSDDGTSFNMVTVKYNNAGVQQWVASFDGTSSGIDQPSAIALDANGDVFVTGYTYTGSGIDYDVVTEKYNGATGNAMWSQIYSGTNNFDYGQSISLDSQGDVYIAAQLDEGGGDVNMATLKYASGGALAWDDTYDSGGSDFDAPADIVVDNSDNVYTVGYSENGTDETDYLIRKYNSFGAIQWTQRYDKGNGPDEPRTATFDNTNSRLIITGTAFINTADKLDYWTMSLEASNGNQNWDMIYNAPLSDDDIPTAIDVDVAGNIFLTGKSKGVGTNFDFLTIRYSTDGIEEWADRFAVPGNGLDVPSDIVADPSGDLYMTGLSGSNLTNNDYLTLKYDTLGNPIWSTRFDGPASNVDNALAMAVDPTGNIYVTGNSQGSTTNWDYSTIKYCQHKTDAGVDDTLCVGDTITMNASAPGGSNFTWSAVSGDPVQVGINFSCNSCPAPDISPNTTSVYAVSSENANGCVDFDTVKVVVNPLPGPSINANGPTSFCMGDSVSLSTDSTSAYIWSDGSTTIGTDSIVTVYNDGNYSVTVADSMGCQNTTSQSVTVFALPNLTFAPTTPFCAGDSIQLQVSGATNYNWIGDTTLSDTTIANPYASPPMTTTYKVEGTDANGCIDTADVTATVFQIPAQPIITRSACDTLESSYLNGNQWYKNGFQLPNEIDPFLRLFYNGDYYIKYTDNNGCTVWSDTLLVRQIDTCLTDTTLNSAEYANKTFDFKVYPNPAGEQFTVEIGQSYSGIIQILGIDGQLLEQKQLRNRSTVRMTTKKLPQGLVLVRLMNENSVKLKKLVIR